MKNYKKETFIWEGLGFPIRLINVPLRKVLGEWVLDIDLNLFQKCVLHVLAVKATPLKGEELRFIIDYLGMSMRDFAKLLGVTHAAVSKWENEKVRMNPCTEVYLRLYLLNVLKVKDKEFRSAYLFINLQRLTNASRDKSLLEIDAEKIAC